MAKEDLLEHATSTVDFYELLGVNFENSEQDIRRAYRKTALKYHPDKLGKDFDPDKFHLLQIAHDVLSDPSAKAAYDKARSARLQKQRQHELFEGKRRQMKEDLESRERGANTASTGIKRPREEDEMEKEIRRLAEEGKRRRKEMEDNLKAHGASPPPTTPKSAAQKPKSPPVEQPQTAAEEAEEEDEVARLERRIREVEEAKARRKAEKRARKSGVFVPTDSPAGTEKREPQHQGVAHDPTTPLKRPDLEGLKAGHKASASPKFSFSPKSAAADKDPFAATMERLKAAERQRLEEEIRRQEAGTSL